MSENLTAIGPGRTETVIGIVILFILAGIAAGVYVAQFNFNPAVLAIQDQAKSEITGSAPSRTVAAFFPVSNEFSPLTPSEQFDSETLSDKINGKAELYLSAGFADLQCQRFFLTDQPETWFEVFIYEMADHAKAFSVFSSQRRDDADPLNITLYSYQTKNAVFLTHGNYYAEIISSLVSESGVSAAVSLAEQWLAHAKIDAGMIKRISEIDLFPKTNMIENSVRLLSANVFGYDRFQDIFIADYQFGADQVAAFISQKDTPQQAQELADGYYQFLTAFGGKDVTPADDARRRIILILDVYICIVAQDRFLAGVHEAPTSDIADQLSDLLIRHLSEVSYE